jgi:hypothetical protein
MGRRAEGDGEASGLSRAAFLRRAGAAGAVAMVPAGVLAPAAATGAAPERFTR